VIFNGSEFVNGQHSFYVGGRYSAAAVPAEDYIFDHWESEGQVLVPPYGDNPIHVNVNGNGVLRAIFAAKITFLTDPPEVGTISLGGCDKPSHPNGDWVYDSTLPPEFGYDAGDTSQACAHVPEGYKFDHWSSTARFRDSPSDNPARIDLTGPSSIKAWFSKVMSPNSQVPGAPSGLIATGQYGRVDLRWDSPLSDGGSPISTYRIYRGNSFDTLSSLALVGNQLWYQDTSVTNGQIYYYRVTAVNAVGESSPSNVDPAMPGILKVTISPD